MLYFVRLVLTDLQTPIIGLLFVGLICLVVATGHKLARRRLHHSFRVEENETSGVLLAVTGTLYSVVLAFAVITVWGSLGDVEEVTMTEADRLGGLLRDAKLLPPGVYEEVNRNLRAYGEAVIREEWPAMSRNGSSERVTALLNDVYAAFGTINPTTLRDANIHAQLLRNLDDLADQRRLRLLMSRGKLPMLMWQELLFGGIITVVASYFLGPTHTRTHLMLIAAMAAMIALTLFLIYQMDEPFSGGMRIDPDALQLVLDGTP